MKRFWILLRTEFLVWRKEPVTALGGFIPPVFILLAFGLLFGGRLSFKIGFVNLDDGPYGAVLQQSAAEVQSPFGTPYYDLFQGNERQTWAAYHALELDGVWVVPTDFSERIETSASPYFQMHFNNYNDDRAKNHRIYAAEILWHFYQEMDYPAPPLLLRETYPRPEMVEWLPVIAVGVVLLSFMLGAMMNIFMLTHKEQLAKVTLEFGLAPRSLLWVLVPKTVLALFMGLVTGTIFLGITSLWLDYWPGEFIYPVWLLSGLVCLFWIPLVLLAGLRKLHFFAGAVVTILTGMTVFFTAGGLSLVRPFKDKVPWFSWIFPNIYAVDPLRDLILFQQWPQDWRPTLLILASFALVSVLVGWTIAARQLRQFH